MTLNKNDDCIFCRIAERKSPCAELYSDDLVMAFLDIAPVNKGHALVIPKAHYQDIFEMPATMGEALIRAQQHVGNAIMAATKAEGLNIYMNNKAAAGQVVFHAHWHLIPRFSNDSLRLWPQHVYDDTEEMLQLAAEIRKKLR